MIHFFTVIFYLNKFRQLEPKGKIKIKGQLSSKQKRSLFLSDRRKKSREENTELRRSQQRNE